MRVGLPGRQTDCNGSCVDLAADPHNCGTCGGRCDTVNSTGATCAAGVCHYTGCAAGFVDCDKSGANLAGCETPSTTTSNCGSCGTVCSSTNATTAACTAGACAYTCKAGFSDCDRSGANASGCECATPGCCGSGCQTTHASGVGKNYYDCNALSTYNSASALEACTAQMGLSSLCGDGFGNPAEPADVAVCSTATSGPCWCWIYTGRKGSVTTCANFSSVVGTWT
jgi:hypothetical protein